MKEADRIHRQTNGMEKSWKSKVEDLLATQLVDWETVRCNYAALSGVRTKELYVGEVAYRVQFNPARIVSSAAKVDDRSVSKRKCFLCPENRPKEQVGVSFGGHYRILVNPFPIFPRHLTIVEVEHVPQRIGSRLRDLLDLAEALADYTIFYNGPRCGASAPDHAHFQAGNRGFMPIERQWRKRVAGRVAERGESRLYWLDDAPRTTLVIEAACKEEATELFSLVYRSMEVKPGEEEPMMNLLCMYEAGKWILFIFPRKRHRPACYYAEADQERLLCSPASVDLGGVFIMPVEGDFLKVTATDVAQILGEVCLSGEEFGQLRQRIRVADGTGTEPDGMEMRIK